MTQLRQDYTLFQERDAIIVAIGPENRETFATFWRDHDIPFIGIPDPQHKIADLYGQEVSFVKLGRIPAQMVIDKQGILRYVHYSQSMKDIPGNKEILELLDDI